MIFWVLITIISVAAMAGIVSPLFFRRVEEDDLLAGEKALYSARVSEIDRDLEIGRVSADEANAAKAEVARQLIKAEAAKSSGADGHARFSRTGLVAAAIFLPLFSLAIYLPLGDPFSQTAPASTASGEEPASIQELIAAAERRLSQNPDDLRGWKVIAPVHIRLQNFGKAIHAYRNIIRIEGRSPENLFALGEAIMSDANGSVTTEAYDLFQETVQLQPDHAVANFYLGAHAMQKGDNEKAISIWQAMVERADGTEDWLPTIRSRIAELQNQTETQAGQASAEEQTEMIQGMVSRLEERLQSDPDDKQGWEMLVRSYIVIGRFEDAERAYNSAISQFEGDKEFKSRLDQYRSQINIEPAESGEQ